MRLPAKNSHVRRALEMVAEHGGEMEIETFYGMPRGTGPGISRIASEGLRPVLFVTPATFGALIRWGVSPGFGIRRPRIRLADALVQRLLAKKAER